MNPFRSIWIRVRSLAQRRAAKRDIDEELRFHLEQRTAENIAAGMSPEEAAREARRRFGNVQSVREECRDARGAGFGQTALQDIQFTVRTLRKNPGFTAVAVLTLALGIGANTSLFSLLNLLLFRPGPYPHSDRLVRIIRTSPQSQYWPHAAADVLDYREQNKSLEEVAFYEWVEFNLAEPGEPAERVPGVCADSGLFSALAIQPALGRVFNEQDDVPSNRIAVLGYNCWRRRFGADTNMVGRTLRADGESLTVVGVMPAEFDYPLLWGEVDIWRPLGLTPQQRKDRGNHFLQAFGRLKPGVSMSGAEAELKAICARLPNAGHDSIRMMPLVRSGYSEMGQRVICFTFGIAGFVLLIACVNLANLQLARAFGRNREFAVRAALGAGTSRLLRQMLTESLVLSVIGGVLGLLLAVCCNGFLASQVAGMGQSVNVPMDIRVFGFALSIAVLTGVIFGIAPAWVASRSDVNESLKENRRGATGTHAQTILRKALIVGELAIALALLAGAGLFIRRLDYLTQRDAGWRMDGLVCGQFTLNPGRPAGAQGQNTPQLFLNQLEERLAALPGIENVSFSWSLPLWQFRSSGNFGVKGQPRPKPGEAPLAYKESVSPSYFATLGIRLLEGRSFTADDSAGRPLVAVINETMARRFWPGEDAVGKRIDCDGDTEIVGVVSDVGFPAGLGQFDTPFQVFRPLAQAPSQYLYVELRSKRPAESVAVDLRRTVASLDPDLAVQDIHTARELLRQGLAGISLMGALLAAFAGLGLGLAALGIYGVTAHSVAQRTGELGIRMALGAQRRQVFWLVLRQGLVLCVIGVAFGLAGALAVARLLGALLPELSANDPVAFFVGTVVLIAVALLACAMPARRAARIDPMNAMRCE